MKRLNVEQFADSAVQWIKEYAEKAGVKGFVLGVSGGVDSAVVSTLCARTGLPVLCLEMPIHQDPTHTARSTRHIEWLKSNFPATTSMQIDLTAAFDALVAAFNVEPLSTEPTGKEKLAEANTRSRLRMATIYYQANNRGLLVAGTGNKVEDFGVGYFTKGGDGSVDFSIIGDITKTEVWEVARYLCINDEIVTAAPTDGLWAGSPSDEDQIGASYPELEWAMEFYETNIKPRGEGVLNSSINTLVSFVAKQETENVERKQEVMRIYLTRNRANRHKMDAIPVFGSSACRESVYSTAN